jgi:hypothetical protein
VPGGRSEKRRVEAVSRNEAPVVGGLRTSLAMDVAVDPSRPHPFAHDIDPEAFYRSPVHESVSATLVPATASPGARRAFPE